MIFFIPSRKSVALFLVMILSLSIAIPMAHAIRISVLEDEDGNPISFGSKGKEIRVIGEDVVAGFDVKLYWDNTAIESWDGEKGLLNTSKAESDGTFEIWFDVPEAVVGTHNVWVFDTKSSDYDMMELLVVPKIDAPPSGLPGADITVEGYGFARNKDVAILLSDGTYPFVFVVAEELDMSDGVETEIGGKLEKKPIVPGTLVITAGAETLTDDGDGSMTSTDPDTYASINYVTGTWEIEFNTEPTNGVTITADYGYFDDVPDTLAVLSTSAKTNNVGSFSKVVEVPDFSYGSYKIFAYDEMNNNPRARVKTRISDFMSIFGSNQVIMIYPSDSPDKPLGCGAAMMSDWLASAFIYTKLGTVNEGLDTDPGFVNPATGKAVGDSGVAIISFGGPLVNPVVKYAESESTPEWDRAPIKCVISGDYIQFHHKDRGFINDMPISEITGSYDYFVIEVFEDGDGRYVMLCYGFGWKGTLAAGKYFDKVVYPNLELFEKSWLLVKWEDTNGDGFVNAPGDGDTYVPIDSGF